MSRALESSVAIGSSVERRVIDADPGIQYVGDSVATWHDARAVDCLEPDPERPFFGIAVVEPGTEIEIKGAAVVRSNGDRERPGHWYLKRDAHERLLEAGAVYALTVYGIRPSTPLLAAAVIPASLLDEHLAGKWYGVDADRSESEVAQLTWTHLFDRDDVDGVQEVSSS